jgi:hypothetical protein
MPSLPIVLAHGYLGFGTLGPLNYFNNVASILQAPGATQVFAPDVPPKGTLQERSAQLAQAINDHLGDQQVHAMTCVGISANDLEKSPCEPVSAFWDTFGTLNLQSAPDNARPHDL